MRLLPLLLGALLSFVTLGALAPTAAADAAEEQQMIDMLNVYRNSQGLQSVRVDPGLTQLSLNLATMCAQAGSCSHTTGGTFQQRTVNAGYTQIYGGECIFKGGKTVEKAITWWKGSPVHNSILLTPQVTRGGMARVDGKGTHFVLILTSDPVLPW